MWYKIREKVQKYLGLQMQLRLNKLLPKNNYKLVKEFV